MAVAILSLAFVRLPFHLSLLVTRFLCLAPQA